MSQKSYDNTNRFVLFKNDTPKNDDRDADYSGTLNVDGEEFFIDGWVKKSQAGKTILSGRIKPKQQRRQQQQPVRRNQGPDDSDEIPL